MAKTQKPEVKNENPVNANTEIVSRETIETNPPVDETNPPAEDKPKPPTREELWQIFTDAQTALTEATLAGKMDDIIKLSLDMQKKLGDVKKFDADELTAKTAREEAEKRERQIDTIAAKFEIDRTKLVAIIEADKNDANQPLREALVNVFGGKITHAKDGQTGKSLTGGNTSGNAAKGGKSADIEAFLAGGNVTRKMLLEAYPTEGNPDKINGTARTVVSNGGWKINTETGFYEKSAK